MRLLKPTFKIPSWFSAIDLILLLVLAGLIYGIQNLAIEWKSEFNPSAEISLSFEMLPYYALLSLSRGFAAYLLSLLFTLIYGYAAAYNRYAEKAMLPLLDILQAIPVLGFLPGLVLGLVALFPKSNVGLELACILMVFTGQVWNMTFSFYSSLKGIPENLRAASSVYRLDWKKRLFLLELPFSAIGLVWNSMLSMAGGWFFLTVTEAFVLGKNDFRLPGIGSYMSVAIQQGNWKAMVAAIAVMALMIVIVDQLFWKPLVAWSHKFKMEESESDTPPSSKILDLLRRSRFFPKLIDQLRQWTIREKPSSPSVSLTPSSPTKAWIKKGISLLFLLLLFWLLLKGGRRFFGLLGELSPRDFATILSATGWTFLRVICCLLLGTLWTLPVGIWIGSRPRAARFFQPAIQVLASFPAPMIFPLIVLGYKILGGTLQTGSVLLMMIGTQWYILFNVIAGVHSVPQDLKEAASLYHLSWWSRMRHLTLPALFPSLLTGWVSAAGGAWNASIVSEYVNVKGSLHVATGIGALISLATDQGNFPMLAGSVFVMALVVVLWNRLCWRKLYELARNRFGIL